MKIAPNLNFTVIKPEQKSLNDFVQMLKTVYQNFVSAINGQVGFGDGTNLDNINGSWINVAAPAAPNTDFTVNHNLGRIPSGYWVMQKDRACDVYTGSVAATATQLTLRATVASAVLRLFIIGLLLNFFSIRVAAQGANHSNIALKSTTPTGTSGLSGAVLQPIPNAIITVCNGSVLPVSGTTCTGLASIFSNITLTTTLLNPTSADANGNFTFYATAGQNYVISVGGVGLTTYSYVWTAPVTGGSGSFTSLTVSGTTTTTVLNCKSLEGIRCVDPTNTQAWPGAEPGAWLNAAIVAAGTSGNPAGSGTVMVMPGGYTATTTVTIVSGVTVKLSGGVTWASNASPNWTLNGTGSVGANLIGDGESSVNLANTGAGVTVSIATASNFSNAENFAISGSNANSDGIVLGDNTRSVDVGHINIAGTIHCITGTPGASGQILEHVHDVYCHNPSASAGTLMVFDFTSGSPSGITFDNVDANTSGTAVAGWAVANGNFRFNYSASDAATTGYILGTATSSTAITMINTDSEFETVQGILIQGPGTYNINSHNCSSLPLCIAIASAGASGTIIDLRTTGTSGTNDITATAASTGGWVISSGLTTGFNGAMSKAIAFTSPATFTQFVGGRVCVGGCGASGVSAPGDIVAGRPGQGGTLGIFYGGSDGNGTLTRNGSLWTSSFDFAPATAGNLNSGTILLPWNCIRLGTAATNNFSLCGLATAGARTININDTNGVATVLLPLLNSAGVAGIQTKRVAGCATAASLNATCDTTITWTTAFADANYTAVCTGDVVTSGIPIVQGIDISAAKTGAAITVRTISITAAAAQFTTIDCKAQHD